MARMIALFDFGIKIARPILVQCLECGKKFTTTKEIPECPRCHGVDIDVRN